MTNVLVSLKAFTLVEGTSPMMVFLIWCSSESRLSVRRLIESYLPTSQAIGPPSRIRYADKKVWWVPSVTCSKRSNGFTTLSLHPSPATDKRGWIAVHGWLPRKHTVGFHLKDGNVPGTSSKEWCPEYCQRQAERRPWSRPRAIEKIVACGTRV